MAVIIPSQYQRLALADYQTNSGVRAGEWQTLFENQNYLWSVHIAHLAGYEWSPAWETTSTTYVQSNSDVNELRQLDQFAPTTRLRKTDDTGDVYVTVSARLENCNLRAELTRLNSDDTTTSLGTTTISEAGGPSFTGGGFRIDDAKARDFGSSGNGYVPLYLTVEAKVPSSGTAYVYQIDTWEAIDPPTVPR